MFYDSLSWGMLRSFTNFRNLFLSFNLGVTTFCNLFLSFNLGVTTFFNLFLSFNVSFNRMDPDDVILDGDSQYSNIVL